MLLKSLEQGSPYKSLARLVKTNWDLSQDEVLNLSVSTNAISVSQAASSNSTFDITSNTSWKATSDQTWLTLSSDTGVGNANITVTVEANATLSSRTSIVAVTTTDLTPEVITVTQDAAGTAVHTARQAS